MKKIYIYFPAAQQKFTSRILEGWAVCGGLVERRKGIGLQYQRPASFSWKCAHARPLMFC
jgi:hypothetical protein